MSRVREAIDRGDLASAAEWEAAACERDGYGDTAELIRQMAARLDSVAALAQAEGSEFAHRVYVEATG